MKIPTSPLLFTLALSSSTLAYPTPRHAEASPNPEASPLLPSVQGTPDTRAMGGDDGWGMMEREKIPGRFARRFGTKRQTASANGLLGGLGEGSVEGVAQTAGGVLKDPTAALGGLGLGSVGSTVTGLAGGLLGPNGQNSGFGGLGAGLLDGSNGQGLLGSLTGVASGLPVVGGLVGGATNGNGLGGLVNGLPVVGGVIGGLFNGNGVGGLVNGLPVVGGVVNQAGKTLNNMPIVGGVVGGVLGQATQQRAANPVAAPPSAQQLAQNANVNLGQGLPAGTGNVPSVVASLGEGQYLLSSGQVLDLGNLGNIGNIGNLGAASNLPLVGGLGSQITGAMNGAGGAGTVDGLRGQAQGDLGGLAGASPLGSTGQYVNFGGQLVPLEQAQQILAKAGINGVGSYASDPAFDDGNTTSNSTESLGGDDENHQTPAEAFQAADPSANATEPSNDPSNAATQSLLAANAGQEWGGMSGNEANFENGAPGNSLPGSYESRLENAAHSVDNGYQNPYPEYRYSGNDDALELIMGAMGGTKPVQTSRVAPTPSLPSAPSSTLALPTGMTAGDPAAQDGYGTEAKAQKGWENPSHLGSTSRPAQASSSTTVAADPTQSSNASAPAPTPTSADDGSGFQDDGSWAENDTWGDWVSAAPSTSQA